MLNYKHLILFLAVLITTLSHSIANPLVDKAKAKIILSKTNRAIGMAHMTTKRTQKFTGNLGKAVKHARLAKKLYLEGNYDKSIYHSLFARKLASSVMKDNNAKPGSDFLFSAEENTILSSSPSDETLINEATNDNPETITDESTLNGNLGIDVL